MQKKERQSNVELLRIVLMLMIVSHHFIVHGLELKNIGNSGYEDTFLTYLKLAINSLVIVAVNTFVFISGFYGIKLRWGSFFSIVGQAVFYSIGLYLIFSLGVNNNWNFPDFVRSMFPILTHLWWFMTVFVALILLSPFLNKGVEMLERNQLKLLVAGMLFMDCILGFIYKSLADNGYSIFNFVTIYLLARYIGRFGITVKRPLLYFLLLAFAHTTFSSMLFYFGKGGLSWEYFMYHNPLIIASSYFLFMSFYQLKTFSNKLINIVSGLVLGVYLLHDYRPVREVISRFVQSYKAQMSESSFLVCLPLGILAVFIIAASIEYVRQILFRFTVEKHIRNLDFNPHLSALSSKTVNILLVGAFCFVFGILLYFKISGQ